MYIVVIFHVGDYVVQMYISMKNRTPEMPIKELKGFEKIHLKAKNSQVVTFEIPPYYLRRYIEQDGAYQVLSGTYTLRIGDLTEDFIVL